MGQVKYLLAVTFGVALLAAVAGCDSSHRKYPAVAPVVSSGKEQLYKHFDSEVKVSGRAATDPKGGVMVVLDDGTPVYVPEMKNWPAPIDGRRVSITGVLHRIPAPPAVAATPAAAPAHAEDRFVLNAVRWEPGTPPKATSQPAGK